MGEAQQVELGPAVLESSEDGVLRRPSQGHSESGQWPLAHPEKGRRPEANSPKSEINQEGQAKLLTQQSIRASESWPRGRIKVARFTSCGGLRSGVWGNTQSGPTVSTTISSVHDAMDGGWRDLF